MDVLLDTHVVLWLQHGDPRLSAGALAALAGADRLLLSAVTAFEYEDLHRRGRLGGSVSLDEVARRFEMTILDLPAAAWQAAARLPDVHRDPLDRMLVAHAVLLDVPVLTADRLLRRYPIRTLW